MKNSSLVRFAAMAFGLAFASLPAFAQQPAAPAEGQPSRVSPHDAIYARIGRDLVSVVYGRPYSKDPKSAEIRKIWGKLVPYGKVWRVGADEATLFLTEKPVMMGGTEIPAGAYTLFLQPEADGSAKLIVNRQVGQWGETYDAGQDLARIDLAKSATPARVDQFTMGLKQNKPGLMMTMTWENLQYSVPIMPVKAP